MSSHDDTEALRDQVAALQDEVARLRAWQASHVCMSTAKCTCAAAGSGCPQHLPNVWTGYVSPPTFCGGAAPMPIPNLVLPTMNAADPIVLNVPTGCAGQTYTFTVPC